MNLILKDDDGGLIDIDRPHRRRVQRRDHPSPNSLPTQNLGPPSTFFKSAFKVARSYSAGTAKSRKRLGPPSRFRPKHRGLGTALSLLHSTWTHAPHSIPFGRTDQTKHVVQQISLSLRIFQSEARESDNLVGRVNRSRRGAGTCTFPSVPEIAAGAPGMPQ